MSGDYSVTLSGANTGSASLSEESPGYITECTTSATCGTGTDLITGSFSKNNMSIGSMFASGDWFDIAGVDANDGVGDTVTIDFSNLSDGAAGGTACASGCSESVAITDPPSTYDAEFLSPLYIKLSDGDYLEFTFSGGSKSGNNAVNIPEDIGILYTNVPEPASMTLFGSALLGFGFLRRRRRAAPRA